MAQVLDIFLVQYNTPDWVGRGARFYEALKSLNFGSTYQTYHPGVTLMWIIGSLELLFRRLTNFQVVVFDHNVFFNFVFFSGLVLFLVNLFFIGLGSIFISKVFGKRVGLISFLLMLFEPFLLGFYFSIGPDGLFTSLCFAFLASFLYLFKTPSKLSSLFSGVLLGFIILTKITGFFLIPFILVSWFIFYKTKYLKHISLLFSISALTFFVFFPALWVKPFFVLSAIYKEGILGAPLNDFASPIINNQLATNSVLSFLLSYPLNFIFRTSPFFSVLILLFVVTFKKIFANKKIRSYLLITLIFLILYLIPISISDKKIYKYTTIIFIPFVLCASVGFSYFIESFKVPFKRLFLFGILAFYLCCSFSSLEKFSLKANPLLGGGLVARKLINFDYETLGYYKVSKMLNNLDLDETTFISGHPEKVLSAMLKYRTADFRGTTKEDYIIVPYGKEEEFLRGKENCFIVFSKMSKVEYGYPTVYKNICKE